MKSVKKKSCFVIGPIGKKGSEIRKKADQLLKHIIAPAVTKCGYAKPVRADNIGEPGIITSQIIDHVINDDLVVADLTGNNPNVFYELAIRHVARKSVVNLVEEGQEIAFDVNQFRAIRYDLTDPDNVKAAIKELIAHIKGGERQGEIENPIANAIDLLSLRSSQDPTSSVLARMEVQLGELYRFTVRGRSLYPGSFMKGVVKKINPKGFGYITPEDGGKDFFFHANHVLEGRFSDLNEGDFVFFEIIDMPKGSAAGNVTRCVPMP